MPLERCHCCQFNRCQESNDVIINLLYVVIARSVWVMPNTEFAFHLFTLFRVEYCSPHFVGADWSGTVRRVRA